MRVAPLSTVGITRYHRPADGFTIIRDSFLRNAATSLRAFRVGAYVLSHAAGFIQTQRQIARACGLSVTTVREALVDLERDRYLARRVLRDGHGRVAGTAYAVSDQPFTDEELAQLCPPCTESECRESVHTESVPPKKTTPARETTSSEKTRPSGGSLREPDRPSTEEDGPMPPAQELAFDLDLPEPEPPARKEPSAADVVAAFVDSYRRHHSGADPLKRDTGRVARDAKQILDSGRATVAELSEAATAMGSGPYANLGVQLNMRREGRRGTRATVPVAPRGSFDVASASSQAAFLEELHRDRNVAAWVAEDPEAVQRYIALDPSLAAVFAAVQAA